MKLLLTAYRSMFARTQLLPSPLRLWSSADAAVRAADEPPPADHAAVLAGMQVLWDGLPTALMVCDLDTRRLLHLNPAAERLLGLGREQLLAETPRQTLDPALAQWWQRQQTLDWPEQAGAPEELRLAQPAPERWLQLQRQQLALADPPLRLGLLSLVEVSQRRQLERALQESDTRFREVTEAMRESLFVTNLNWDTLYFSSPLLLDILGLQASELRVGPGVIRQRVHPDDRGRGRQPRQERLPGQHEPRDPHADERHHRPDLPAAARQPLEPIQRERLAKVSDAAHHLLSVINDILDLSKIEAGKLNAGNRRLRAGRDADAQPGAGGRPRARQGPGAGGRHRPHARCCAATRRGCRRRC
jgi:PAS domain-containing protein